MCSIKKIPAQGNLKRWQYGFESWELFLVKRRQPDKLSNGFARGSIHLFVERPWKDKDDESSSWKAEFIQWRIASKKRR